MITLAIILFHPFLCKHAAFTKFKKIGTIVCRNARPGLVQLTAEISERASQVATWVVFSENFISLFRYEWDSFW